MLPMINKYNFLSGGLDDLFGWDIGNDYTPKVNIWEDANSYKMELVAPGLSKEDFKIEVDNKKLTISSEKQSETKVENEAYMRKEFCLNKFKRSFQLPDIVNEDDINAKQKNGILYVNIPKKKEISNKKIKEISIE
jgi:HSP20 family protein